MFTFNPATTISIYDHILKVVLEITNAPFCPCPVWISSNKRFSLPENSWAIQFNQTYDVLHGQRGWKVVCVNTPNVGQRVVSICGLHGARYKKIIWHGLKLTPEAFKQPLLFDNEGRRVGVGVATSIFNSTEAPQGSMLGLDCKLLPDPSWPSACGFPDLYISSPSVFNAAEPEQHICLVLHSPGWPRRAFRSLSDSVLPVTQTILIWYLESSSWKELCLKKKGLSFKHKNEQESPKAAKFELKSEFSWLELLLNKKTAPNLTFCVTIVKSSGGIVIQ